MPCLKGAWAKAAQGWSKPWAALRDPGWEAGQGKPWQSLLLPTALPALDAALASASWWHQAAGLQPEKDPAPGSALLLQGHYPWTQT